MEILVGLGVIIAVAWLLVGPIFTPEPEGFWGFMALLPWLVVIIGAVALFAWGLGSLALMGINA